MSIDALPVLPAPACEWTPAHVSKPCGRPATHTVTTHDFLGSDPNATRTWFMCVDCQLRLLEWAQRRHLAGEGSWCKGCNAMITPTLGGLIIAHGELTQPEQDVRYDR